MESLGEISFLDTFYLEAKALKNIFLSSFCSPLPFPVSIYNILYFKFSLFVVFVVCLSSLEN